MATISAPPSWIGNLVTLGIARAKWISEANAALGHSTGFLFAYFLQAFANYGLAGRFNAALGNKGSAVSLSPFVCFLFTGWPLFGAVAQMRKGTAAYNG